MEHPGIFINKKSDFFPYRNMLLSKKYTCAVMPSLPHRYCCTLHVNNEGFENYFSMSRVNADRSQLRTDIRNKTSSITRNKKHRWAY